ncbi:hypothetical protein FRC06_010478 [Ceratobasidium sp. 370]|nr:hypothetical protein FRC06_010478 [Ceratobasidium sp. 370]
MAGASTREGEARASTLYDHAVQLVAEIGEKVRGLDSLLKKLRKYESLVDRSDDWHPAAAQVSRALETFADNADLTKHTFPDEFLSRLARGHYRWDVTALRDWIQSKPFWDDGAGMIRGGTAGIAVGFFAILHYALNVTRVMPKNAQDADRLCDQDKAVYGRADFRTLSQCVDAIAQQLAECPISELAELRLTGSDFEDRYSAWLPNVWVQRDSDGTEDVATITASRPSFNVFSASAGCYMISPASTGAATPSQPAERTPESPTVEPGAANITNSTEDDVSAQADVSMNDPETHPGLNVAERQPVDTGAVETRHEDVAFAVFEGATTSTPRGEGQARQPVFLKRTTEGDEPHAVESPIASESQNTEQFRRTRQEMQDCSPASDPRVNRSSVLDLETQLRMAGPRYRTSADDIAESLDLIKRLHKMVNTSWAEVEETELRKYEL